MRTLKENFFGNLGIGKKNVIEDWLKKYNIKNYTINSDFTIDVNGYVNLKNYPDKELPEYIQFNQVDKDFDITGFNLISLKGCPKECSWFYCPGCKSLTSLEGAPKKCKKFNCNKCDNLTSLEGAPSKCRDFFCCMCDNLTSLEGAPKKCDNFYCSNCNNLTSLEGAPKVCKEFHCEGCKGKFTEEDVKKVCSAKIIYCDDNL